MKWDYCNICKKYYKYIECHIYKTKKHKLNSINKIQEYFKNKKEDNVSIFGDIPDEILLHMIKYIDRPLFFYSLV